MIYLKVLAVMGSPRRNGNTQQVTRKIEKHLENLGEVEFEYVYIKDYDLKQCLGCGSCFVKGEETCPLNDDRTVLEDKMRQADGVIFTSPNYVFNVTGLMKNFIDRLGYICHRPRFFKNALILSTSGIGAGSGMMKKSLEIAPMAWGFKIVENLDLVTEGDPQLRRENFQEKDERKVQKAAKKFYSAILDGRPKPNILAMAIFLFSRGSVSKLNHEYFDYRYYQDHGWLEEDAYYFHDPEANFMKKKMAQILSKFMGMIM